MRIPEKNRVKKWIPKQVSKANNVTNVQQQQQPIANTPVGTALVVHSDDEAGWRVEARRFRDKDGKGKIPETPIQNSHTGCHLRKYKGRKLKRKRMEC